MRWLALLGALVAASAAVLYLARRPYDRPRSRTLADLAAVVLSLVLVCAAALMAHWFGIFSVPLVVLAFVPFGIAVRWLLFATRGARRGREMEEAATAGPWARFSLPMLVAMVVVIAAIGVAVGTLIGPH